MSEPGTRELTFWTIEQRRGVFWIQRDVQGSLRSAREARDKWMAIYKDVACDWRIVCTLRTDVSRVVE